MIKKKIMGVLMAALMVFTLSPVTAIADDAKGTIIIDNAAVGEMYKAYQLFELDGFNESLDAYQYKPIDGWKLFLQDKKIIDTNGNILWENFPEEGTPEFASFVATFAQEAVAYAVKEGMDPTASMKAEKTTVELSGLPLGYYVINSTTGTLCALDTVATSVRITEKNEGPGLTKEVKEDSTDKWGESNNANINQKVNFKSTIKAKKGAKNYVYHDVMDAGLDFDANSVKVTVNDAEIGAAKETYELKADLENCTVDNEEKCTFEITFAPELCDKFNNDTVIEIEYAATLNESAVIAGDGNKNKAQLTYGDNAKTAWDETTTYTGSFAIFKHDKDGNHLAGAVFVLKKENNKEAENILFIEKEGVYYIAPQVDEDAPAGTTTTTDICTVEGTDIVIKGLDAGTYYLYEKTAPAGFNKVDELIGIKVEENGTVSGDKVSIVDAGYQISVLNNKGLELPSTGGIGTTIFYVGGGILVIGAIVYLVTRRRAKSSK